MNMKKTAIAIVLGSILYACGPSSTQSGVDNDGIKTVDSNGALPDDTSIQANPSVDTARGEDRVDIQKRDSANR
jgi:hypothetical protein